MCSIAGYFYFSPVFWVEKYSMTRKNMLRYLRTKPSNKFLFLIFILPAHMFSGLFREFRGVSPGWSGFQNKPNEIPSVSALKTNGTYVSNTIRKRKLYLGTCSSFQQEWNEHEATYSSAWESRIYFKSKRTIPAFYPHREASRRVPLPCLWAPRRAFELQNKARFQVVLASQTSTHSPLILNEKT